MSSEKIKQSQFLQPEPQINPVKMYRLKTLTSTAFEGDLSHLTEVQEFYSLIL